MPDDVSVDLTGWAQSVERQAEEVAEAWTTMAVEADCIVQALMPALIPFGQLCEVLGRTT